jgi:basic membrane protein A
MTSAEKKVDVAVETAIKTAQDGSIKGGTNTTFDLKNDGVGIGKTNSVGAKYEAQVQEVADKIKSGEITDIPDTVAK